MQHAMITSGDVTLVNAYWIINTVMATTTVMMEAMNHLAAVSRTMQMLWLFRTTFTIPSYSSVNTIHMYSGITSGRVLNGELLYTKILEVNLFAFAYRLFRRDFSPLDGTYCMGTHSFLQPYIHFVLIFEGFMNGQSWSLLLQFSVLIS